MYAILRDNRFQNENMRVKNKDLQLSIETLFMKFLIFCGSYMLEQQRRFRIDHYPLGLSEKSANAGVIAKLNVIPMFDRLLACWGICDGQLAYLPTTN